MRSRFSALRLAILLGACTSSETSRSADAPAGFSASTAQSDECSIASDVGSVASDVGKGAFFGALAPFRLIEGCSGDGDGCAYALLLSVVLVPIGAVIGAGAGLAHGLSDRRSGRTAAALTGGSTADVCPDRRVSDWLGECRKAWGPMPPASIAPSDASDESTQPNPEFQTWFDACEAMLERKWDSIARTRVPAQCQADDVPSSMRVKCLQSTAGAKQHRRVARELLQAERAKLETGAPLESGPGIY